MDNSYPNDCHVKLHKEFKLTVLSVNRFACAAWYSMNGENDEFQTVINFHKILTACVATGIIQLYIRNLNQYLVLKLKATSKLHLRAR